MLDSCGQDARLHLLWVLDDAGTDLVAPARERRRIKATVAGVDAEAECQARLDDARTTAVDAVVTGVATDVPACHAMLEQMRSVQPKLRVIELVDDDNAFAFSVPGSDIPARVGRRDIARTLVSALSQELDNA